MNQNDNFPSSATNIPPAKSLNSYGQVSEAEAIGAPVQDPHLAPQQSAPQQAATVFDEFNAPQEQYVAPEEVQPQAAPAIDYEQQRRQLEFESMQKANQEAQRELEYYRSQFKAQQPAPAPKQQQEEPEEVEEFDDSDLRANPDDIATKKDIQKYHARLSRTEKRQRDQIKRMQQQQQQINKDAIEARLRATYPDMERVITNDNIKAIAARSPSMYNIITSYANDYEKAVAAYEYIKSSGIYKEAVQQQQNQSKILKNLNQPKPTAAINRENRSSYNAGPSGRTSEEQRRASHWAEMNEYASQY